MSQIALNVPLEKQGRKNIEILDFDVDIPLNGTNPACICHREGMTTHPTPSCRSRMQAMNKPVLLHSTFC